ncbi:MAG: hypothetical protein EBR09_16740, partial [Proteobacteria bacterium]|nr:hypothetical protein [Pseudomonadota bacterium]
CAAGKYQDAVVVVTNPPEASRTYSSAYNDAAPGTSNALSMLDSEDAWVAKTTTLPVWMQIDLGSNFMVHGVVTQSRKVEVTWVPESKQHVLEMEVQYSLTTSGFVSATAIDGTTRFFLPTAWSSTAKTMSNFSQPVTARYIRIYPQRWRDWISMRAGVLTSLPGAAWNACADCGAGKYSATAGATTINTCSQCGGYARSTKFQSALLTKGSRYLRCVQTQTVNLKASWYSLGTSDAAWLDPNACAGYTYYAFECGALYCLTSAQLPADTYTIPDGNCQGQPQLTTTLNGGSNAHCVAPSAPNTANDGTAMGGWHRAALYKLSDLAPDCQCNTGTRVDVCLAVYLRRLALLRVREMFHRRQSAASASRGPRDLSSSNEHYLRSTKHATPPRARLGAGARPPGPRARGKIAVSQQRAAANRRNAVAQLRLQRGLHQHLRPRQPRARVQRGGLYGHGHFGLRKHIQISCRWRYQCHSASCSYCVNCYGLDDD